MRPGASPAPMARGPVTILGGASPVGRGPSAPRPEIPADVPPVRRTARDRAEGLPGGRVAPDPLPRQPPVLGLAAAPGAGPRAAAGDAGPPARRRAPARGRPRAPRAAVGLAARAPAGVIGRPRRPSRPA